MPRDGEVDYSAYSNAELLEAAAGINADLVPENYRRLVEEMQARGISASPIPRDRTGSRTVRIVGRLALALFAAYYLIFSYGSWRFPDGVSPCGENRYCGKQGQAHSLDDYHAYVLWERALLLTGIAGVVSATIVGAVALARSRSPESGS